MIDNELINRLSNRFSRKILKEQLEKGNTEEVLEFVLSELIYSENCIVNEANKKVNSGITDLISMNKWSNLSQVSEHAIESAIFVLNQDGMGALRETMLEHMKARLWFMQMDGQERLRIYRENKGD